MNVGNFINIIKMRIFTDVFFFFGTHNRYLVNVGSFEVMVVFQYFFIYYSINKKYIFIYYKKVNSRDISSNKVHP